MIIRIELLNKRIIRPQRQTWKTVLGCVLKFEDYNCQPTFLRVHLLNESRLYVFSECSYIFYAFFTVL